MRLLKQSTAYNLSVLMVDATDHVTGKTGLTLTIEASKDGGAFDEIEPDVTELGDGWYALALTSSHTDTEGDLVLHITASGADPTDLISQVRPNVLGDTLPANVTHFGGSAGTFASGIPAVNTTQIEGSDATDQIRDAVVDDATRIDASALNTASAAIGSDGSGLTEAGGTGDHLTAVASASALATVDNNVDAILSDTGTDGVVVASGSKSGYSLAADQSGVTVGTVNALGAQAKADVNAEVDQALADYDAPTKAELDAAVAPLATATALQTVDDEIATIDSNVDAIKAKTDNLPSDPADQSAVEAAIDAAESAILSAIGDVPTNSELTSALETALTTAVADSVPSDGNRPSIAQAAYITTQFLLERAVTGTTMTVRKPDGSTALLTLTLDDATAPTSVTRTS